jgi:signal transduction histidine kinase
MFALWKRLSRVCGRGAPRVRVENPGVDLRSIEVLAYVAHEARQPLSTARAAFEVIRKSPDEKRRERAYFVLDRQLVRLAALLDDLLEASRLRLGKTILQVEELDLRRLVAEAAESVELQVAEKHQRLETHLPSESVWVEADSARLQQVVSNLLVNGVQYTDPGGRLWVDLTRGAEDAVLTVGDTGRGITADFLPHIFEPFVRSDASSEPGLGIGLAIARQLVELHGGTIRASSAGPGNGSEFVVTLPAHRLERRREPMENRFKFRL